MKYAVWAIAIVILSAYIPSLGASSSEETQQTVNQNDDAQVVAQVANAFGKMIHGAVVIQNSASHKDKNSQQNFESAMHEIAAGIAIIQSISGGRAIHMQTFEQNLTAVLKKLDRATLNQILKSALAGQPQQAVDAQ